MPKVVVVVVEREGFNGRFRAGKFWPTGKTVAEVTDKELVSLKSDPMLAVAEAEEDEEITQEALADAGEEIARLRAENAALKAAAEKAQPPAPPTQGEGLSTGKSQPPPQGGRGR